MHTDVNDLDSSQSTPPVTQGSEVLYLFEIKVTGVLHGDVQDERGFWFLHGNLQDESGLSASRQLGVQDESEYLTSSQASSLVTYDSKVLFV